MQNVIPLYRPPIWRRVAIGVAILAVLGFCASVAFAGDSTADQAVDMTARRLC